MLAGENKEDAFSLYRLLASYEQYSRQLPSKVRVRVKGGGR